MYIKKMICLSAMLLTVGTFLSPLAFSLTATYPQGTPSVGVPPQLLGSPFREAVNVGVLFDASQYKCNVTIFTRSQSLRLKWVEAGTGYTVFQNLSVGYYPTAVHRGTGHLEFYVAGRTARGKVVIEKMTAQYPTGVTKITDINTGNTSLIASFSPLVSIDRFFDVRSDQFDIIEAIAAVQGASDVVCVKTLGVGNVYSISVDGATPPKLLAATTADPLNPSALIIPELSGAFRRMVRMHHPTKGYVTLLTTASRRGGSIALNDPDKDHVFEGHDVINSTVDWVNGGFGSTVTFLPLDN